MAGISSGTRGTLLAIIIVVPLIIWLITRSYLLVLIIVVLALASFWLLYTGTITKLGNFYRIEHDIYERLVNGIDTIIGKSVSDYSIKLRIDMWTSSLSAIKENLFWGYDNSNRFTALSTHLPEGFKAGFSHPHNDIFASIISTGLIGGVLAIFSLLSPILAGLLSKELTTEKVLLGSLISMGILITANVNTVFFNDITAAWLAFSTFLIWNVNYNENTERNNVL